MDASLLEGRTAFVTGAGKGLGKVITLALLRHGARVVLSARDRAAMEETIAESGVPRERAHIVVGDLETDDEVYRIAREVVVPFGTPDILVNNAGIMSAAIQPTGPNGTAQYRDATPAALRRYFQINSIAPYIFATEFMGPMLEKGWGRIINISTSLDTMLSSVGYGASKASLEAHTAQLSRQLEGSGVTANAVLPGGQTATPGTRHSKVPQDKMLKAEVMAAPVVWLSSKDADGVNGRRFIGALWDASLPAKMAAEKAGAPIAWTGHGPKAVAPAGTTR